MSRFTRAKEGEGGYKCLLLGTSQDLQKIGFCGLHSLVVEMELEINFQQGTC